MPTEFGFVCNLAAPPPSAATLVEDNRRFLRALAPPFTSFWTADHLQIREHPVLECWTALCIYAAEFPRLRCGTIVLGQSYRNPALLAKMAAVFQRMSGGRLIFGLGAGWKEDEYRAYGYDYPPPAVRVAQLDEALQITRIMWTEPIATFEGKYYTIRDAVCSPRPNPIPPILVGGGGEQLTLRVVARHADWWNLPYRPLDEYRRKVEVLHDHCRRLGRDTASITLSYLGRVSVATDPSQVQRHPRQHTVAGTPAEVAAELQHFIDAGVQQLLVHFSDFPSPRGFELFQREVVPRLDLRA